MGGKSLVQGLNAAATAGFEPNDPKSDAVTDWPLRSFNSFFFFCFRCDARFIKLRSDRLSRRQD